MQAPDLSSFVKKSSMRKGDKRGGKEFLLGGTREGLPRVDVIQKGTGETSDTQKKFGRMLP